jgi:hypothetical protein
MIINFEKEHGYDSDGNSQVTFKRVHSLGHDWVYVSGYRKGSIITDTTPVAPFSVVHDPECPCHLEGISIDIFGPGKTPSLKDNALLETFKDEYEATFPRDEAEPWDEIVDRCCGVNDIYPGVGTYMAVLKDRRIPVGALIVEHYKTSNVLLITYCFVKRAYRRAGKGYARKLMLDGSSEIRRRAGVPRDEPRILFEGENPDLMPTADIARAPFDPYARLKWFDSLGARRLPIRYAQPPLSKDRGSVPWLNLYCLGEGALSLETLTAFLKEFYKVLEVNVAPEDLGNYHKTLDAQLREIAESIDYA